MRPTAIFANNDYAAVIAMSEAQQMGLAIPDDISVVGYDNSYLARLGLRLDSVRVLKLNGQTIGMLVMGSQWRLWKMLDGRMAQGPSAAGGLSREFADFLVTVLSMSKIHVLAVHPNQQVGATVSGCCATPYT